MLVVLIDKLLKTQVVECQAVASWLFAPEVSADFTRLVIMVFFFLFKWIHAGNISKCSRILSQMKAIYDFLSLMYF